MACRNQSRVKEGCYLVLVRFGQFQGGMSKGCGEGLAFVQLQNCFETYIVGGHHYGEDGWDCVNVTSFRVCCVDTVVNVSAAYDSLQLVAFHWMSTQP